MRARANNSQFFLLAALVACALLQYVSAVDQLKIWTGMNAKLSATLVLHRLYVLWKDWLAFGWGVYPVSKNNQEGQSSFDGLWLNTAVEIMLVGSPHFDLYVSLSLKDMIVCHALILDYSTNGLTDEIRPAVTGSGSSALRDYVSDGVNNATQVYKLTWNYFVYIHSYAASMIRFVELLHSDYFTHCSLPYLYHIIIRCHTSSRCITCLASKWLQGLLECILQMCLTHKTWTYLNILKSCNKTMKKYMA